MFNGLLIWCFAFLGGIGFIWGVLQKFFHKSDWRIILPVAYGALSLVGMATIYPGREVAQMEFGFIGIGFLSLPSSSLMPVLRSYLYSPIFEFLGFDYCSVKVFSIGFSLMTLGCV